MPKIVDSEEYRKELLQKCFELFAERGYAKVTTRQIAQVLGISTGAMYHYFPSKQALFEQLVEEICDRDVRLLRSIPRGGKLAQRLERLGELLIQHEAYLIEQSVIWHDFYQHHALAEIQENHKFQQLDRRYQEAMEELLDLGNPKLAKFIWTLINAILLEQIESDRSFSFTEQVKLLIQMIEAYADKHLPH
jgi:AcrR family transcriptional regulator